MFEGNVKDIGGGVSSVSGIDLARPWAPLTERYAERKITDSFWYETGTLLDYVAKSIQQLSGPQAVRKVEADRQVRLDANVENWTDVVTRLPVSGSIHCRTLKVHRSIPTTRLILKRVDTYSIDTNCMRSD